MGLGSGLGLALGLGLGFGFGFGLGLGLGLGFALGWVRHLLLGEEGQREQEATHHARHDEPVRVVRVERVVEGDLLAVLRAHVAQEALERLAAEGVDPLRPPA